MDKTIFISNHGEQYRNCENCHGGEGPFSLLDVINKADKKQYIKFIHDDIIPPGSSFGNHQHKSEEPIEEWYFCLEGEGTMTLDGKDYPMKPGDISACYAMGNHSVKNTGNKDMRIIVIFASAIEKEKQND